MRLSKNFQETANNYDRMLSSISVSGGWVVLLLLGIINIDNIIIQAIVMSTIIICNTIQLRKDEIRDLLDNDKVTIHRLAKSEEGSDREW